MWHTGALIGVEGFRLVVEAARRAANDRPPSLEMVRSSSVASEA